MSEWPAPLRGVTETVVTTRGPNGLWNLAALGVHAPERSDADSASGSRPRRDRGTGERRPAGAANGDAASNASRSDAERANGDAVGHAADRREAAHGASGSERGERHASHAPEQSEGADRASGEERPASTAPATARTFGRTRTWRNFRERGEGYVQFVDDPVTFVEAALSVVEREEPVLPEAAAWARVDVERTGVEEREGTPVATWALSPVESRVVREAVPTTNRGYAAVIEATVAASRLDVPGYDTAVLRERLDYFESVCERCGGSRERAAFERLRALSG